MFIYLMFYYIFSKKYILFIFSYFIMLEEKESNVNIDYHLFKKMCFIFNAIEKGWDVKKRGDNYIFIQKHEGKKEIFNDSFLSRFMNENLKMPK